jgi:arsenate reductase
MIKIYHNPRCRKSRAGLTHLETKKVEFEVIDYLKNPISEVELADLLMKLNKSPQDIIRTQEEIYKSNFKGKNFADEEWIKIMVEYPKLIHRPIVVRNYKAVLGQPPEEIDTLFK